MVSRRSVLLLAALQTASGPMPAVLARAVLLPGQLDAPQRDAQLCWADGARFSCPPFRARLRAVLPLRAGNVAAVGFACDGAQSLQDVVALVGEDGGLLALERLTWRAAGIGLATRLAMLPDREHLSLTRETIATNPPRRLESWTDYLRLTSAGLVDAPARPVSDGTMQQALATQRAAVAAMAKCCLHSVPPEMLAALRSAPF